VPVITPEPQEVQPYVMEDRDAHAGVCALVMIQGDEADG